MANIYKINVGNVIHDIAGLISTAAVTVSNNVFTGSFDGVNEYTTGLAVFLKNDVQDSASSCTLQINSLGQKPIFLSNNITQRLSTEWKRGTSALFIYDGSLSSNGGWVFYAGLNPEAADVKVEQKAATSENTTFPVILGETASTGATVSFVNKASSLTYNPSTGVLSATKFSGDGSGLVNVPGGTDVNVTQNAAISTSGDYPVLLANSTATTEVTGTVNKTSSLLYNPNTGLLKATKFSGDGSSITNVSANKVTLNVGGDVSGSTSASNTITLTLGATGVTGGTYGPTSGATLSPGGTFTVPKFQVNNKGLITEADQYTFTLPSGGGATPSTTTPAMDGTATVGIETDFARGDHVHPSDTSKVSKSGDTMTGILTCQNNTSYSTKQARNIFIISQSASLPTGDDGDICLIY